MRREYAEVPWDPEHVSRQLSALFGSRESLERRLRKVSRDQRVTQVAGEPFVADGHDLRDVPAWAGLTSYVEQRFGVWAFAGGTVALRDALVTRLTTRRVAVVAARAHDVVVREGQAVAVSTSAGDLDADVVVCAVDPRRLPVLAPYVARTRPAPPPLTCHVGLAGVVPDLPHELVLHGDPLLVVRTPGRAPDGHHAWTVHGRGRVEEDLLVTLARRGVDVREQVVSRIDLSPGEAKERWGGSPLGVQWAGRTTVRRRLGPRTPVAGLLAAGAHAAPGAGLPFVGLSAALVAQVVGPA